MDNTDDRCAYIYVLGWRRVACESSRKSHDSIKHAFVERTPEAASSDESPPDLPLLGYDEMRREYAAFDRWCERSGFGRNKLMERAWFGRAQVASADAATALSETVSKERYDDVCAALNAALADVERITGEKIAERHKLSAEIEALRTAPVPSLSDDEIVARAKRAADTMFPSGEESASGGAAWRAYKSGYAVALFATSLTSAAPAGMLTDTEDNRYIPCGCLTEDAVRAVLLGAANSKDTEGS